MDTIAVAGGRCNPEAEAVIQGFIPAGLYDLIIARYDQLSTDEDEQSPHFLQRWFRMAAIQDSRWKRMMIMRFFEIVTAGGSFGMAELVNVMALAAKIQARQECRQVFLTLFGQMPHPMTDFGTVAAPRACGDQKNLNLN